MLKLKCVCGAALALAISAAGCSDSDDLSTGDAGASSAGRAGSAGGSGKGGGSAQAGNPSEAGTANQPAEGGAAGDIGTGGGSGSDSDSAGQGGEGGAIGIGDCLPDGTELQVTASGNSAYVFSGLPGGGRDGEENPHFALCRSYTYTFVLDAAGHPFYFKTDDSLGSADAYDTGVTNNGAATGTISWTLAGTTPGLLYYQCSLHQAMGGTITVVEPP